jgi:hypothetical protein
MNKKGTLRLFFVVSLVFSAVFADHTFVNAYTIPDTGVTYCVDNSGSQIACPQANAPYYGQDAQYGPGAMSYAVHGNGTATDNNTGLMWEIKDAADGAPDLLNPNDADNTYTWDDTQLFVDKLNAIAHAGYTDWRLPAPEELDTILDLSITSGGPTVDQTVFSRCKAAKYWTKIEYIGDLNQAWNLDFSSGEDGFTTKSNKFSVRAVRGHRQSSFVDNQDGTITDSLTGLTWQQQDSTGAYTWEGALDYSENMDFAGCTAWRLPNRKELENVIDRAQSNPAINSNLFSWNATTYWTSTPVGNTGNIWIVDLQTGRKNKALPASNHYVIAVSGGCELDRTAPQVVSTSPANGATNVSVAISLSVTFSEEMDPATITTDTFKLITAGNPVPGAVSYASSTAVFTPSSPLSLATLYTAKITTGARDVAGNGISSEYQWNFVTPDNTAPTGSIVIDGASEHTNSVNVTLALPATDDSGVVSAMQLSNDNSTWSAWEEYAAVKPWTLATTGGDGEKTVYVKFKDMTGNESSVYSDTITLDTGVPALAISPVNSPTNLTSQIISGTTDQDVTITAAADTWATIECSSVVGTAWECSVTGLAEGDNTLTVKASDVAGNITSLAAVITVDSISPIGTVSINNGDAWTNSQAVTLNVFATDNNGVVASVRFAEPGNDWSIWESYSTGKSWVLSAGDGDKTVNVQFMDAAGNESDGVSATIKLDTVPPMISVDATTVFTQNDSQTISGGMEDGAAVSVTAASGSAGVVNSTATTWNCTISSLSAGVNTITVTATDAAGNSTMKQPVITYDITPPTGTVSINQGAEATGTLEVTLSLSAADDSGNVASMQFNDGGNWSDWENFAVSKSWALSGVDGTKTVSVHFRDAAGNISAAYSDSINLDTSAPFVTINAISSPTNVAGQSLSGTREAKAIILVSDFAAGSWVGPLSYSSDTAWACEVVLAEGINDITVTAIDTAGNVSNSAALSVLLDTVAGVVVNPVVSPTNVNTQLISGTMEAGVMISATAGFASVGTITTTSTTWEFPFSNLASGSNTVTVTGTDGLGNTNNVVSTIAYDNELPTGSISINDGAGSTNSLYVSLTLSAADNSGPVTSVQLSNDGVAFSDWRYLGIYPVSWSLVNGDGLKTVYARFKDAAGNVSIAYSDTITLDTVNPFVTVNSVVSPTNHATQLVSGSREAGVTLTVNAPAGLAIQVSYPEENTWQCTVNLHEGFNAITVKGTDPAGNSSSVGTGIILDSIADITIDSVFTPTGNTVQTISGTREAGAAVSVTVNTAATAGAVDFLSATTWRCELNGLVPGNNVITAIATDSFSNTGTANATINLDTISPTGSIAINGGVVATNSLAVTLSLTANDNSGSVASMRFRNEGQNWSAWEQFGPEKTWYIWSGDGTKTVYAQFMDIAGNVSEYSNNIILDTVKPVVNIDSVLSPTNIKTQVISGTMEAGATVTVNAPAGLKTAVTYPTVTRWSCEINLLEGWNTLTATASDSAGNVYSASTSIKLDTVASISIDALVSPTNKVTQTITGTREAGASAIVTLNSVVQNQTILTGTLTWQCALTFVEGANTLVVDSVDALGNPGSISASVILDTVPPTVSIDPVISLTNQRNQVISGSREAGASVSVSVPGASVINVSYPASDRWSSSLRLGEGLNSITVTARDAAGNTAVAIASTTLDTIARVSINTVNTPTNSVIQTLAGTREAGANITVSGVTAGPVNLSIPTSWSCDVTLVEGANTVTITAEDALGNINSVSATIVLDTIVPTLTIDPVVPLTSQAVQTITGTKSNDGYISISGTGINIYGISYPNAGSWSCRLALREGDNNLTVTVTDKAGNHSSAVTAITLDSIASFTVGSITSPTNKPVLMFGGIRESNLQLSVSSPEAFTDMVVYKTGTTWECQVILNDGVNSITINAVDALGNTGIFNKQIVLDTTPPMVTIDPVSDLTNVPTQTLTGTRDSDGKISINASGANNLGISYPSESTWKSILVLPEGANNITVKATDAAGNSTSASTSITVDTTAKVTIYPLRSPINKAAQNLRGTRESGAGITVSGVSSGPVDLTNPTIWNSDIVLAEGNNTITVTAKDALFNETSVQTTVFLDTVPPSQVLVTATDTFLGGTIELDWSSHDLAGTEGVSEYRVFAYKTYDFNDVSNRYPVKKLGPGTKTFTANGLTDNELWYFAVVGVDAAGNYNPSVNAVSAVPTTQGVDGYITDSVTGGPLQGATVHINPTTTTNEEGYYLLTGLSVGTYQMHVSGAGYRGEDITVTVVSGQLTKADVVLVSELQEPSIPQDVVAEAGDGEVVVRWTPVDDLDLAGYNLYRFLSPADVNPVKINHDLLNDTFYVDMEVVNGTAYYYTVRSLADTGVESVDSEMVNATPQAGPPEPASDLEVVLNSNNSITLTWVQSPTPYITAYNIYWNNGTGSIDYSNPYATVGAAAHTWTSGVLASDRTYYFGIRTEKGGIEEANTSLVVSLTVPVEPDTGPSAVIKKPKAGSKISGNRVTVRAELVSGSIKQVENITFQYRPSGGSDWSLVPAAVVPHPNPDSEAPYKVHWDVSGLVDGDYELRALTVRTDGSLDPEPSTIIISIDNNRPRLCESSDMHVNHRARQVVKKGKANFVEFTASQHSGSFEVSLPVEAPETDTMIIVENPKVSEMRDKVAGLQSIDRFLRLRLASGQKQFAVGREIEISIPYPDDDDDGYVDGYGFKAANLTIRWYNPATGKWEKSGISNVVVDTSTKTIKAATSHFSDFTVLADTTDTDGDGLTDLEEINVYGTDPNNPDTDYDGMPDGWEVMYGLDPLADDSAFDPDHDGISNIDEYNLGTNPNVADNMPAIPVPVHQGWWFAAGMLLGALIFRKKYLESLQTGRVK